MSNYDFNPPYVPKMGQQPLAKLFAQMYGDHFLYCYDSEGVMAFIADRQDCRWAEDVGKYPPCPRLSENVGEFLALMVEKYNEPDENGDKPAKLAGRQLYSFQFIADVTRQVVTMLNRVLRGSQFDRQEDLMGIAGGRVLDLKTGVLRAMELSDHITKRTIVVPDSNCKTPLFDEFMHRITLDDLELEKYLLRFAGYTLSGSVREECIDFWLGEKAQNGKTTLANILQAILRPGSYCTNISFKALADTQDDEHQMRTIGHLVGMRLAVAMEGNARVGIDQALFNRLTSKDPLRGKKLFENSFTFQSTHKLIVGSNHAPKLNVDAGSRRRLHLVPFEAMFLPKEKFTAAPGTFLRDRDFGDKLVKEYPGIFHKFVQAGIEWRERGSLEPPKAIWDKTDSFWADTDLLGEWERDHKADSDCFTETKKLYRSFTTFMEGRGKAMSAEEFGSELRKRGYTKGQRRVGDQRPHGYEGLKA